jgi:cell division septum initiation protein DivIVA
MLKLNKNICWVDQNRETVELSNDEVIAMYNELRDDYHTLCEENEELREQLAELQIANGKALKALRKSGATIQELPEGFGGREAC